MRYLTFFLFILFVISCKDENQELSENDVRAIFTDSASGKVLKNVPNKYEAVRAEGPTSALVALTSSGLESCGTIPANLTELNSGWEFNIYKFNSDLSASANAMGFSGSIGKKEMVFIQDYVRFKMLTCNGESKRVGIGLRCIIHVKSLKGKIGYSSLPSVAANVEMNRATASFGLRGLGFGVDGKVLAGGLPAQGDYDVENFGNLAVIFHNVLTTLSDSTMKNINPVILPDWN